MKTQYYTATSLDGFIATEDDSLDWLFPLGDVVVMEAIRSKMVVTGKVAANGFVPDNANLSPFMQWLARAHANCLEGLPIFGG